MAYRHQITRKLRMKRDRGARMLMNGKRQRPPPPVDIGGGSYGIATQAKKKRGMGMGGGASYISSTPVSYTHLTLPTKRIV